MRLPGPVRGRSPLLLPSSPPALEHDAAVDKQASLSSPESSAHADGLRGAETILAPAPRTPTSVRGRQQDTSSAYYTAAWGSPYELSPSLRSARTALSEQIPSEELSESSPIPNFGLEHLVPSRLGGLNLPRPVLDSPGRVSERVRPGTEDRDSTPPSRPKRWVQLPRRNQDAGKQEWWSDESAHSVSDREQRKSLRISSSAPTPRPRRKLARGHKSRGSNQTINQQSFWDGVREHSKDMSGMYASRWAVTPPAEETPQKPLASSLFASRWADTPPSGALQETKDLPRTFSLHGPDTPPSVDDAKANGGVQRPGTDVQESHVNDPSEIRSDHPGVTNGQTDGNLLMANVDHVANMEQLETEPLVDEPTGPTTIRPGEHQIEDDRIESVEVAKMEPPSPVKARLEASRPKKKVSWRGKTCIISIPSLDYDGTGLVQPLSLDEAKARLREFEEAGYGTAGFDMPSETNASEGYVHAKPIFPDEADTRDMRINESTKVRLPDLTTWAAYMDDLTEQKLAALGVSTGSEEPTVASSQDQSRQSSAQYPPLPFSPPLLSGSANSMSRPPMARGHSHAVSVASPISPLGGPFGHMHRHSTFTGSMGLPQFQAAAVQPFTDARSFSPYEQLPPQQPALPGRNLFSPLQQFAAPGPNRVDSPAGLVALRNDLGFARGPGSPLSQQVVSSSMEEPSRSLAEDQWDGQKLYSQPSVPISSTAPNGLNIQMTPTLPQLPEEEDEEELLDVPAPEPEPESQSEMPTYVPPHKRAELNANIAVPTPRGHRHNISEGLERDILESQQRHDTERRSWIEVEEEISEQSSLSDPRADQRQFKPTAERDPLSQDYPVQEATHYHKKSASRLNVSAPTFNFNPDASIQPTSTAFTFGASAAKSTVQRSSGHNRQQSSVAFNVTAPEFKPANLASFPKSDFNFSSDGPTFNPNAPSFTFENGRERIAPDGAPRIFSHIDISDFVKPATRSKAVAIRKPDDSYWESSESTSENEDEEGRIAQSDARLKRLRKTGDDGDEVPRFAEPTPMPAPAAEHVLRSHASESEEQRTTLLDNQERVQNSDDEEAHARSAEETVENLAGNHVSHAYNKSSQAPVEYHRHKHSNSLSALAKPFEPLAFSYRRKTQSTDPERVFAQSDMEDGEVNDDLVPRSSPPRSPTPSELSAKEDSATGPPVWEDHGTGQEPPVADGEPSFAEIDAVMRQLNEVDPDQSAQEGASISPLPSPGSHPMRGVTYLPEWTRSDAPSPSPRRRAPGFIPLADSSIAIHEHTDDGERVERGPPALHRLEKAAEDATSDWSADFPANDEDKLHQRSNHLDNHIDNLIGGVLEKHLRPLEESLRSIQNTISTGHHSRDLIQKRSSSVVESDADDEDEMSETQRQRPISRGREKKVDQIKSAVLDALREHNPERSSHPGFDLQELQSYLADMKASFARAASSSLELEDIRAVVEDAVAKKREEVIPIALDAREKAKYHMRERSELENRLNQTLDGMLDEGNLKRAAEEREAESRRALQQAAEELRLLREASRDDNSRIVALEREREDLMGRLENAEESQRESAEQAKNLEAENAATYATLEEYRMSSTKWRHQIDQATQDREELEDQLAELRRQLHESQEANNERRQDVESFARGQDNLERTIEGLERQLEESQEASGSMRRRLEKLHFDMAAAAGQLASDKSAWRAKEGEYRNKCDSLEAQVAAHIQSRSKLEDEMRGLQATAKEASDARSALDQMKMSNGSLDEMVRKLQMDLTEQQSLAARFERDFHDAKEAGRVEVQRVRMSMETDHEGANRQANNVRADLESEISKLRGELENVKMEAGTTKARHERLLEEEDSAGRENIRKVNQASSIALDEARQKHETSIHELQTAHERALRHAVEDKERSEVFSNERLTLADAKLQHFQDKVLHLEERLEVAKSAAQAAVVSAQSRAAPITGSIMSSLPEKVSPQALRESILVLQEQLHDRESTIESLRSHVSDDTDGTLRSREDEVAWLRELLTVRNEELTDLINTLARPVYDRNAVRNIAIRIRANLQMEQQEKERFASNDQSLPEQAMASLSNFATPKATQLSSAFNKWRASMESSALRTAAANSSGRLRSNTPSRAPAPIKAPPAYMNGLMTPPASNLRNTPSPEATGSLPPPRLHSRPSSKSNDLPTTSAIHLQGQQASLSSDAATQALFRSQSYDQDAEDHQVHMQNLEGSLQDDDLDGTEDHQPPAFRSLETELEDAGADDALA